MFLILPPPAFIPVFGDFKSIISNVVLEWKLAKNLHKECFTIYKKFGKQRKALGYAWPHYCAPLQMSFPPGGWGEDVSRIWRARWRPSVIAAREGNFSRILCSVPKSVTATHWTNLRSSFPENIGKFKTEIGVRIFRLRRDEVRALRGY